MAGGPATDGINGEAIIGIGFKFSPGIINHRPLIMNSFSFRLKEKSIKIIYNGWKDAIFVYGRKSVLSGYLIKKVRKLRESVRLGCP